MIFLKTHDQKVDHASPFILTKSDDGKKILFCFEQTAGKGKVANMQAMELFHHYQMHDKKNTVLKQSSNFPQLLSDRCSCTVLAINTLKNCLTNDDFIAQIKGSAEEIAIQKVKLGQGREFAEQLDEKVVEMYFHNVSLDPDKEKKQNLALFYKGHDIACKIFGREEHLALLDPETKSVITMIEDQKKLVKAKRGVPKTTIEKQEAASAGINNDHSLERA